MVLARVVVLSSMTGCVSFSWGGHAGVAVTPDGKTRYQAGAGFPTIEYRNVDHPSDAQRATLYRMPTVGIHFDYEPDGAFFGGGPELQAFGVTRFWGGTGIASNLVLGGEFDETLHGGASVSRSMFYVRIQVGLELETTHTNWTTAQGPMSTCAVSPHHSFVSILPGFEYRLGTASGPWFTLDTGYRRLWENCNNGGI